MGLKEDIPDDNFLWHHWSYQIPDDGLCDRLASSGFVINTFSDIIFLSYLIKADMVASGKFVKVIVKDMKT